MSTEHKNEKRIKAFGDKVHGELSKYTLRDLLSGNVFEQFMKSENLLFLFFCFGLVILNVANHYGVESLLRENDILKKELNNMEQEAITTSSELMYISKRSQVRKRVEEHGVSLVPLSEPPRSFTLD